LFLNSHTSQPSTLLLSLVYDITVVHHSCEALLVLLTRVPASYQCAGVNSNESCALFNPS